MALLFHSQLDFFLHTYMKMSFSPLSPTECFGIQIKFENNLHTMALLFYTLFY